MTDLVALLERAPLGRVFLANLHFALKCAPAHIDLPTFRAFWTSVRATIHPGASADAARGQLFDAFYEAPHLALRFRRPATVPGATYEVHTTITPFDLVANARKAVFDEARLTGALGRAGKPPSLWDDHECVQLCNLIHRPYYLNGRDFAHQYNIFWATLDGGALTLDADTLRDRQGLVHVKRGEPVLQLTFRCDAARPRHMALPTAIEATDHRRFKARPMAPTRDATAADLAVLRQARALADGVSEVTLSSVPMAQLVNARFAGRTNGHADISGVDPTDATNLADDETFAGILMAGPGGAIVTELVEMLEK